MAYAENEISEDFEVLDKIKSLDLSKCSVDQLQELQENLVSDHYAGGDADAQNLAAERFALRKKATGLLWEKGYAARTHASDIFISAKSGFWSNRAVEGNFISEAAYRLVSNAWGGKQVYDIGRDNPIIEFNPHQKGVVAVYWDKRWFPKPINDSLALQFAYAYDLQTELLLSQQLPSYQQDYQLRNAFAEMVALIESRITKKADIKIEVPELHEYDRRMEKTRRDNETMESLNRLLALDEVKRRFKEGLRSRPR
jgi:hypothetical protein